MARCAVPAPGCAPARLSVLIGLASMLSALSASRSFLFSCAVYWPPLSLCSVVGRLALIYLGCLSSCRCCSARGMAFLPALWPLSGLRVMLLPSESSEMKEGLRSRLTTYAICRDDSETMSLVMLDLWRAAARLPPLPSSGLFLAAG